MRRPRPNSELDFKGSKPQSSPALPLIKSKLCRANSVHRAGRRACLCFYAAPRARISWFYGCRRRPNGPIYAISCIMASSPHTVSWSSGFLLWCLLFSCHRWSSKSYILLLIKKDSLQQQQHTDEAPLLQGISKNSSYLVARNFT